VAEIQTVEPILRASIDHRKGRRTILATYVRPFETKDREALHQIGADTAFFGEPVEHIMEDRRIFIDRFYVYFTDYEPEHTWVACVDERVVGFIVGCINGKVYEETQKKVILPGMMKKFFRGYYRPGFKTFRYIWSGFTAVRRGEIPEADETIYPAHLHINLLPAARGLGLGRKLMEAYINQLKELGIPGVYLQTTTLNMEACKLFEKVGFQLSGSRPNHMYTYAIKQPFENLCYVMKLTNCDEWKG
jgi:ribosomal protein S18 acetylase RimI-like enzyme